MAQFRLSQDDINRTKLVDPNLWYDLRIEKVYDEPSSKGDSTNTKVDCRVVGSPFDGMVVTAIFNEKAPGTIIPFVKAFGVEVEADASYDPKAFEGRMVRGFITHREWKDKNYNNIADWSEFNG